VHWLYVHRETEHFAIPPIIAYLSVFFFLPSCGLLRNYCKLLTAGKRNVTTREEGVIFCMWCFLDACGCVRAFCLRWLDAGFSSRRLRFISGDFMWDSWWTKWHRDSFFLLRLFGLSLLIVPLLLRTDLSHRVILLAGSTGPDVWLVSD